MSEKKQQVLQFVKERGPVIPVHISRSINTDILMASAILSELVSENQLRISKAKFGGSPMYYLPGQEERLQILRDHIGERPKKIFDELRDNKVLQDSKLEPWERVAVREINDFAKPLEVTFGEQKEIFWKWYMLNDEETSRLIENILKRNEVKKKEPKREEKKEEKREKEKEPKKEEDFYREIKDYLERNRIRIVGEDSVKKKEIDLLVEIESQLGNLKYLLRAKDKKKINENDITLVHSKAQNRKLPAILLSSGELTKKAEQHLEKNERYVVFKTLK